MDKDEKEERKRLCREFIEYWYSKIGVLSLLVSEKKQKKAISRYRKLITTPEAKYPKVDEIQAEFVRYNLTDFIKTVVAYEKDNPGHMDVLIYRGRLETLCNYPQVMRDTYDARNPPLDGDGKPMMNLDQFYAFTLKEKQANKTSHTDYSDGQVEMDPIDGKRFKNAYKKYVKEWKEKWQSK